MIDTAPNEQSDEELARLSRGGCLASFEVLVQRFEGRILQFLQRFVGHQHDAEDLTQITFVKAWRGIQSYQPIGSFSTWLFTIAKRTALNHFRGKRAEDPLPDEEGGPSSAVEHGDPSLALAEKDDAGVIWETARLLKPDQHEALWLRYGEGFSVAESARIMQTNQLRVRVLLHRGRQNLASLLAATKKHQRPALRVEPLKASNRVENQP